MATVATHQLQPLTDCCVKCTSGGHDTCTYCFYIQRAIPVLFTCNMAAVWPVRVEAGDIMDHNIDTPSQYQLNTRMWSCMGIVPHSHRRRTYTKQVVHVCLLPEHQLPICRVHIERSSTLQQAKRELMACQMMLAKIGTGKTLCRTWAPSNHDCVVSYFCSTLMAGDVGLPGFHVALYWSANYTWIRTMPGEDNTP